MNDARSGYRIGLLALAGLLLTNAALGPVGLDLLRYPLPESLLNQLRGLEIVTVGLVVPCLLLAAGLVRRGRREAPLLAVGPCGYASYMFVQYVVGPDRTTYSPGLLLHLVVFSAATLLCFWSWSLAARTDWPVPAPRRRRRWLALLAGLAGFVLLRYLPLVVGAFSGAAIPEEFAQAPAFYWSIVLLDLGLVVPMTLVAAGATWRGSGLALPATYAVVGWFALVPPSVAAMAVVMLVRDDTYASVPTTLLLVAVAAATSVVAFRMFRVLLGAPAGPKAPAKSGPSRGGAQSSAPDRRTPCAHNVIDIAETRCHRQAKESSCARHSTNSSHGPGCFSWPS
jgi:hypothetical protein